MTGEQSDLLRVIVANRGCTDNECAQKLGWMRARVQHEMTHLAAHGLVRCDGASGPYYATASGVGASRHRVHND